MMRLVISLLLLTFAACAPASAPEKNVAVDALPKLGGVLGADTLLAGDYLLQADLAVPAGVTLTIQPGSRIYILPSDSSKIDPEFLSREVEIIVRGRLLALGEAAQPIRFVPLGDDPQAILWAGIELVGDEQSRLQHLVIEQAEAGLRLIDSQAQVDALQVLRSRYGITLQQSAPQISNSLLSGGESGLFCWDGSAPRLKANRIERQQEEGLYLARDCRAELVGNLVTQNDRGVVLPAGWELDGSNRVFANRLDRRSYPAEAHR